MFTPEDFQTMQIATKCLIEVVFLHEKEFKQKFITTCCNYREDEYNIHNAHISGYRLKTVIEFDDGSKTEVITALTEVIGWYYKMAEENK